MAKPVVPQKLEELKELGFSEAIQTLGELVKGPDITPRVLAAFLTGATEHNWGEQANDLVDAVLLEMWDKGCKSDGELATTLVIVDMWLSDAVMPMIFGELSFSNSAFAHLVGRMSAHTRASLALYVLDVGRRRLAQGKMVLGGSLVGVSTYAMLASELFSDEFGKLAVSELGQDHRCGRALNLLLEVLDVMARETSGITLEQVIAATELIFDLRVPEHEPLDEPDKVPA